MQETDGSKDTRIFKVNMCYQIASQKSSNNSTYITNGWEPFPPLTTNLLPGIRLTDLSI